MLENRFRTPVFLNPFEKKEVVEEIKDYLFKREGDIIFAYLYGSFIKDEAFRDIDVALFMKEPITDIFNIESDLSYELSTITNFSIEVRIINMAPVALQMAALRANYLLFSKDESIRTDFIQDVGKRYIEYSHLREMAR